MFNIYPMKYFKNRESLLERRNIGTIYHFTSLVNTFHIITNNQLESYREIDEEILKIYKSSSINDTTFSFTRNKNLARILGQGQIDTILTCRISLDGTKLSDKYKIRPFNWQSEWEKEQLLNKKQGKDYISTNKLNHEAEEMIITNSNHIDGINNYITNIDIPPLDIFKEEFEFYADSDPNFFYRLESIVHLSGYDEEEFNEYEHEYTDDMIKKVYKYIVSSLEDYIFVPLQILNIT